MSELKYPKIGNLAPKISLLNQDGEKVSLKNFRGEKNIIIYFYPKAMTPGCTVQACGLRDSNRKLKSADTIVFGISPDSVARLDKFRQKENLNFDLLSDSHRRLSCTKADPGDCAFGSSLGIGVIGETTSL